MGLFLTRQQKAELLSELDLERNRKYADRIRVILLSDEGEPADQIARYFFLHEGTVRNYQDPYKEGGLEGLIIDDHSGRMSYLSLEQKKELSLELESKIYPSTRAVVLYVKEKKAMVNAYFSDIKVFRKELMLFLRGVRKYKAELSTLITDNFHIIET